MSVSECNYSLLITQTNVVWAHYDTSVDGGVPANTATPGKDEGRKVSGVVTGASRYGSTANDAENSGDHESMDVAVSNKGFSNSWKLNVILALISCWFAMALTSWGSVEPGGDSANPEVGEVSMWMLISAQWLFMILYMWSLVAPRLFPDRDFS